MGSLFSNPRRILLLALLTSLGAVGAALVTQHVFDMQPCPWCILQRLIFVAIAAAALLGLLWNSRMGVMMSALLMDGLAASGVAAALWQHFVAASASSCNLTLADRIIASTGLDGSLPEIFAPRASCADAAVTLFGVPYEFWSLATFAMLGALAVLALLSPLRHRR
ncbi:MAG: disulfide bond formation protein B [Rubrivivax sp.]|nr:disulfide bond formation protein B [Rubrivivax sp.]